MHLLNDVLLLSTCLLITLFQQVLNLLSGTEASFVKDEIIKSLTFLNDQVYVEGLAKSWLYLSLIEIDEKFVEKVLDCFSFVVTIISRLIGKL